MRHPVDLASLPHLPVARLRALWSEHMGRAAPPSQKCLLVRELAWRLQARAHGGLDRSTQRLLRHAMREAVAQFRRRRGEAGSPGDAASPATDPSLGVPDGGGHAPGSDAPQGSRRRRRAQAAPELSPGTRLVRTWHGTRHEVHALADGKFGHRSHTYASLSEVARAITGARWSGPRFFGLTTRAGDDQDNGASSSGPLLPHSRLGRTSRAARASPIGSGRGSTLGRGGDP